MQSHMDINPESNDGDCKATVTGHDVLCRDVRVDVMQTKYVASCYK